MGVGVTDRGGTQDFLVSRYPQKTEEECQLLSVNVIAIMQHLFNCPSMELLRTTTPASSGSDTVKERVRELKNILRKVADARNLLLHQGQNKKQIDSCSKKRSYRVEEIDISSPRKRFTTARVTPPTSRSDGFGTRTLK